MFRNTLAILLGMLFAFSHTLLAQSPTPEPAPWPPDPNEIFADGVSWSVFDESLNESLMIDHQQRFIRVKDAATKTWHKYPFPVDKEIYKAELQPDNRIWVSWSYEDTFTPDSTLVLNPNTGLYEPPDTVCEGKVMKASKEQGQWQIVYRDALMTEPFLCHSETDEQRTDLPPALTNWSVFPTQDRERLIVASGDHNHQVFVYHLKDGSLLSLGTTDDYGYRTGLSICDWLTDTKGFLCSQSQRSDRLPTEYYAFDITQPDSLKNVFYAWPENLFILKDPKRYFVIQDQMFTVNMVGGGSGNDPFQPCKLLIYDVTGLREHVLGNRCIPTVDYLIDQRRFYSFFIGPRFYYLIKENDSTVSATLYQYDSQQEMASGPLFTDEIESILSISPDDRYVVVILDNGGFFECCIEPQQVGILDTQTWKIVYRSEPMGIYGAGQLVWLDNQTLVIVASATIENIEPSSEESKSMTRIVPSTLRRIDLQDEKTVTEQMTKDYEFSASFDVFFNVVDHYWLTQDNRLVDLNTLQRVPLIREAISPQYEVRTQWNWVKPYGIKINVYSRDDNESRKQMSYLVFLPD